MKVLAVIPARYASTRFPGKPLAQLGGKSILSRVWERANQAKKVDTVIVATDDDSICDHMERIAGEGSVMMTSDQHRSGTDRCGEVLQRLNSDGQEYDIVVNLQGDEPFIDPKQIDELVSCFGSSEVQIATLMTPIHSTEELLSPNNVKVVCDEDFRALYFSRQPIPYCRGIEPEQWLEHSEYYKHVGMYAFRAQLLPELCELDTSPLEACEKLEQLRWLSAGYTIHVLETDHSNIGIDTPEDLKAAEAKLKVEN